MISGPVFRMIRRIVIIVAVLVFLVEILHTKNYITLPSFNPYRSNSTSVMYQAERPFQQLGKNKTSHDVRNPVELADNTMLLLKTGIDVTWTRLPSHVATSLKWYPHHLVYADAAANVNGLEVIDILSYIPSDVLRGHGLEGYIRREEALAKQWGWGFAPLSMNNGGLGWSLDKLKNIPAFAHAWVNHPDYEWYLMIDDDTILFPSTLASATVGMDPNEPHFLGRDVGWGHMFPHGGSGLLLSRGALKIVYGEDEYTAANTVAKYIANVPNECCGDQALAHMVFEFYGTAKDELEFHNDHAFFQGGGFAEQKATFNYWCESVGSFHHTEPWENIILGEWYQGLLKEHGDSRYLPTYYDYYRDFIMPHVVEEIPGWLMHFKIEDSLKGAHACYFKENDPQAQSKESCKKACEDRDDCFAWSFKNKGDCEIFDYGMVSGRAMNPDAPGWDAKYKDCVSGFMVDRILEQRKGRHCDPAFRNDTYEFREGWLQRGEFDVHKFTSSKSLLEPASKQPLPKEYIEEK